MREKQTMDRCSEERDMFEEELLDLQINSEDQRDIIGDHIQQQTGIKDKRGRKRKTKDGQSQSICGCGNVYSCSSALSLHIKNKHGGKVPQGSVGFPSANYRKKQMNNKQTVQRIHSSQQTRQANKKSLPNLHQQQTSQSQSYIKPIRQMNAHNDTTSKYALNGLNGPNNQQLDDEELKDILDFHDTHHQTNHSQTSEGTNILNRKTQQRKPKQNRQYVSKRIYLCGACLKSFAFLQEAMLHIKKQHNGEIPDGSIFGLKRQYLLNYFRITNPKINSNRKVYVFKCGCGKQYSCSSSLYYHIKTVHGGSEPQGTFAMGKPS